MKTQIPGVGLKTVIRMTDLPGWILLARPVIYVLFARRRELDAYSVVDFSALVFILYSIVAFIVGLIALRRSSTGFGREVLLKSPIVIFLIYSIYGFISMAWSVSPILTGFRAFECISMMLLIIAVIQGLFEKGDLDFVFLWSLLFCILSIILGIYRTAQWATDLSTLLESSQMMSTIFFFMALYFIPRKWYNYLIMTMAVFSMSTVAYIGMTLGLVSSFWQKGRTKVIAFTGALLLLLVTIAIGPYALIKQTVFFDKEDISMSETNGRDHLMTVTLESIEEYPMGLGFFAAEPYVLYAKNLGAISAHNSLFSAGLGLGIPGMVVLSIFFIGVGYITFSRYIPLHYRAIIIGCFLVAIIQCMGNPSVGTRVFGAWIPCMYIFVLSSAMFIYGKKFEANRLDYEDYLGYTKLS